MGSLGSTEKDTYDYDAGLKNSGEDHAAAMGNGQKMKILLKD